MLDARCLHAEEVAGRVEDLLVHFQRPPLSGESLDAGPRHGADELGNVREPRFGAGTSTGLGLARRPDPVERSSVAGIIAVNGHLVRLGRAGSPGSTLPPPISGPIRTPSDWTTCVSYALVSIAIS